MIGWLMKATIEYNLLLFVPLYVDLQTHIKGNPFNGFERPH